MITLLATCRKGTVEMGPQEGASVIYAVWEPTDEERECIGRGEPIPPTVVEVVDEEEVK